MKLSRRNNNRANKRKRTRRMRGGIGESFAAMAKKNEDISQENRDNAVIFSNVGNATVGALAATGVGIPFAAVIGGVFLVTSVLIKMKMNNTDLKTVLLDVFNIISNCVRLYELIQIASSTFKTEITTGELKFNIDEEIIQRLNEKLVYLLKNLLEITPDEIVVLLSNMSDKITNTQIMDIINAEKSTRTGIANKFRAVRRVVKRNVNVLETINNIVKNLSVINSYFMLMKGQFDMACDYYQRHLPNYSEIWKKIEENDVFTNFLVPNDAKTAENVEELMKESAQQQVQQQVQQPVQVQAQAQQPVQVQAQYITYLDPYTNKYYLYYPSTGMYYVHA